jgi:alpha-galactosidase
MHPGAQADQWMQLRPGKLLLQAEAMVQYGLVEAGYNSAIFDDCFTEKERKRVDSTRLGSLLATCMPSLPWLILVDPQKGPHGLRNVTQWLKSMGITAEPVPTPETRTYQS